MKKLRTNTIITIFGMLAVVSLLTVVGCGSGSEAANTPTTTPGNTAGVTGIELYNNNCARCHGDDRTGSVYGKSITVTNATITTSTVDQLATLISFHRAGLHLTPVQLSALANFLKGQ